MATTATYANLLTLAPRRDRSPIRDWFAQAYTRIAENRRLAAERDVARFIRDHGGRLTDEVERQIGQDLA